MMKIAFPSNLGLMFCCTVTEVSTWTSHLSRQAKEYSLYRMISVAFKSELSKLIQLIGLDKDTTSLYPQHVASSGCGWRNGLQIWRLAANILNIERYYMGIFFLSYRLRELQIYVIAT
jgi:hypothetical protein